MTNFNTVKRKANVGERILITNAGLVFGEYANGDILTVTKSIDKGSGYKEHVKVQEHGVSILTEEYEVIVENKTEANGMEKTAVIAEDYHEKLAFTKNDDGTFSLNFKQMPALVHVSYDGNGTFDQTFVHGDYKAEAQRVTIESEVGELTKYTIDSMAAIKPVTTTLHRGETVVSSGKLAVCTPQQQRDDIIELAKRDVAKLAKNGFARNKSGDKRVVNFIVNNNKRTVVVLLSGYLTGIVYERGIAKCAPSDCFNAHIGKAIALRRALGLEVPSGYLNAPQPTEVRVGDIIQWKRRTVCSGRYKVEKVDGFIYDLRYLKSDTLYGGQYYANLTEITSFTDDTREGATN